MSDTEAWLDVNVGPKHAEEQVAVVEVRIAPGSRMTVDKVIDYTYAELGPWGSDVTMRVIDRPAHLAEVLDRAGLLTAGTPPGDTDHASPRREDRQEDDRSGLVVSVLTEHYLLRGGPGDACGCGWSGPRHVEHQARVLAHAEMRAEERISAALTLHPPCHDPDPTKWAHDWDCQWGHSREDGKIDPDEQPRCAWCSYDDRSVAWPCPTVQALQPSPETRVLELAARPAAD